MPSKVFHLGPRSRHGNEIISNLEHLINLKGFSDLLDAWKIVAIKLHFGEKRGWGYIHPKFVHSVNNKVREHGCKTFITDTNSVYVGSRSDAVTHIETAIRNGFGYVMAGAPIIIADGLKGSSAIKLPINLKHFQEIEIALETSTIDGIVCLTHFKGHELCGFGGSIKNIGMGLAARAGKLAIHSTVTPYIKNECIGCGYCVRSCIGNAIYINEGRAYISKEKCLGCGQCIISCPNGYIRIRWNESTQNVQEKICEYAYGILKKIGFQMIFFNFLIDITPDCDCCNHSDAPICPDLGILASTDIVAVDQASVDLINKSQGIPNTALQGKYGKGVDKFRVLHPEIDWEIQLAYSEEIGLGSREYELIPFP